MLDWGLFHLEKRVFERLNDNTPTSVLGVMIEEFGLYQTVNVKYRWESNRIDILTALTIPYWL